MILNQTITNPTWPDEEDGSLKVYLFMYVHMFMDHIDVALTYHYYKYSQFSLLLDLVEFRPCFSLQNAEYRWGLEDGPWGLECAWM